MILFSALFDTCRTTPRKSEQKHQKPCSQKTYFVNPHTPIPQKHTQFKNNFVVIVERARLCKKTNTEMKRFLSILNFLIFSLLQTYAQESAVLQIDTLIVNLHTAIELQRSIEIEEIAGVYKLTPWHFAPNLNYDFINNNYYVTISTSTIVSHFISKRQETKRISAANRKYDNQTKTAEIRLKSLCITVNQRLTNLQLSYHIVTNDINIFDINHTQYINNEIDTETFLKLKSAILNKIKSHNTEVAEIQKLILEIALLTETEIFLDLTDLLVSPSKILQL